MMIRTFLILLVCASVAGLGCSGCEEPPASNNNQPDVLDQDTSDAGDAGEEFDVVEDTGRELPIICEANAMMGCRQENTPNIQVCNADGTAIVPGVCGESEICREGECVSVVCVPGARRCSLDSGGVPQMCNEDAMTYRDLEPCGEGYRCNEGFCLDRCEIAEVTNSYIGCEYWAVELENHLLNSGDRPSDPPPLSPERHPPFAIVLANTSDSYDAVISVFQADGEYAEAVPSRLVGTDITFPGDELVRVHSEVVDRHGFRIGDTIGGEIKDLVVPRGAMMTLILPHRSMPFGATSVTDVAYKIVSDQPVVAYQFNPLCCNYNYSNDASLLLPKSALTENYMFMSHAVFAGGDTRLALPYSPTLTVVAVEPNTEVEVQLRPSRDPHRSYSGLIYPITSRDRVNGPDQNGVLRVTLQPHEVFNIAGRGAAPVEDLTGARVTSSKPVSVFGGHTCTNVPFNSAACDHIESQLFPMETWGRRYVAAPLKLRNAEPSPHSREGTYWKFLARENNTRIATGLNLNRPHVLSTSGEGVRHCSEFSNFPEEGMFTLNAGESCEFGTREMFIVEANHPIMLGAFVSGQNSVRGTVDWGDYAGDPSFFLLSPEEQYRSSYSFLTPATYHQSYVTVTMLPGFPVTLDGTVLDLTQFDHEVFPGGGFIRAHIPVEEGPHSISAQVPFGLVVYGYDNYVSYAYTGGLDLVKLHRIEND